MWQSYQGLQPLVPNFNGKPLVTRLQGLRCQVLIHQILSCLFTELPKHQPEWNRRKIATRVFPNLFLRLYCEIYCVRNWFLHPLTALLLRNTKAKGGTRPAEIEPIHKHTDMIIICHIWALENNPYTEIPTEINTCVRPTDTGAFFFCAWPAPVTCLLF